MSDHIGCWDASHGNGCSKTWVYKHTHTYPFYGPFSRTTRVSRYQKGKTNLDFTEARSSEWQVNQLGHMQVCTSLQTDNHASTQPLSFLDRMPFLPPNQQRQSTEGISVYKIHIHLQCATRGRRRPVVTERRKVLAERVDGNSLNKALVFREHPQLVTCTTITTNPSVSTAGHKLLQLWYSQLGNKRCLEVWALFPCKKYSFCWISQSKLNAD